MKKLFCFFISLAVLANFTFTGCSDSDDPEFIVELKEVSSKTVSFEFEEDSKTFTFNSNVNWTASVTDYGQGPEGWVSITSPTTGSAGENRQITIKVLENQTENALTGKIKIAANGYDNSLIVTVTQQAQGPYITADDLDPNYLQVWFNWEGVADDDNAFADIAFSTNENWAAKITYDVEPDEKWIVIDDDENDEGVSGQAGKNQTIRITTSQNDAIDEQRDGTIRLYLVDDEDTYFDIEVHQRGDGPYLTPANPDNLTADFDGAGKTIEDEATLAEITFSANVDWETTITYEGDQSNWIEIVNPTGGSDNGQILKFKPNAVNSSPSARYATIRVHEVDNNDLGFDIEVMQETNQPFAAAATEQELVLLFNNSGVTSSDETSNKVTFSTNVAWETVIEYEVPEYNQGTGALMHWITITSGNSGTAGRDIELDITTRQNTKTDSRFATIRVQSVDDNTVGFDITVFQSGDGSFYYFNWEEGTVSRPKFTSAETEFDMSFITNDNWAIEFYLEDNSTTPPTIITPDWIQAIPASGSGDATVTFKLDENVDLEKARKTRIKVVCENTDIDKQLEIELEQAKKNAFTFVDPDLDAMSNARINIDAIGGEVTVEFNAGVDWEAKFLRDDYDWIDFQTATSGSAGDNQSIKLDVDPAVLAVLDGATIVLSGQANSNLKRNVTISRAAAAFDFTPDQTFTFGGTIATKQTFEYKFKSNADWSISGIKNYITVNPRNGYASIDEQTITITVDPSKTMTDDSFELAFLVTGQTGLPTLAGSVKAAPYLLLNSNTSGGDFEKHIVFNEAGTKTIYMSANGDWTITSTEESVATVSPASGVAGDNHAITITMLENQTASTATGELIFTNGTASETIQLVSVKVEASETVTIPDEVFRAKLTALGITVTNKEIKKADAAMITSLDIQANLSAPEEEWIKDLTGIKAFENLTYLNVRFHKLTSLDLEGMKYLTKVECQAQRDRAMSSLNIINCTNLKELVCFESSLDVMALAGCTNLEKISAAKSEFAQISGLASSKLIEVDVSDNPTLMTLSLQNQVNLTTVRANNCPALQTVSLKGSAADTGLTLNLRNSGLTNAIDLYHLKRWSSIDTRVLIPANTEGWYFFAALNKDQQGKWANPLASAVTNRDAVASLGIPASTAGFLDSDQYNTLDQLGGFLQ